VKPIDLFLAILAALLMALGMRPASAADANVAALLQQQTQELMNAVTDGKADIWRRYLDDEVIYSAEDGLVKNKKQLVAEITPLPQGISGRLEVTQFKTTMQGRVAVTNYVAEEVEGYHGQTLRAHYRSTDTWIETPAGWRLLASQVLALRTDPRAIELSSSKLDEYVGVYTLTPAIRYTISRKGNDLMAARTGRKPEWLQAEVADYFFVAGDPRIRKVFQRDMHGQITGFVERRESWDILWRRQP